MHVLGRRITRIAMPSPDAPLPPDSLGVFHQGTRLATVTVTPDGKRLYVAGDTATEDVSTNVFEELGADERDPFGSSEPSK